MPYIYLFNYQQFKKESTPEKRSYSDKNGTNSINNLDIQNIVILMATINEYQETLLVISHDAYFLDQVGVEKGIELG